MKAILLESKEKGLSIQTVSDPLLKAGMVQLKLKAAALNHRDLWISKGKYAGIKYPVILGSDGAGVVERVGKDVPEDLLGQSFLINPSFDWGHEEDFQGKDLKILGLPENGTLAELVNVPLAMLHPKPVHLTFAQAAALPLAGLTAYRALYKRARLKGNERVLVTGIGGGVALFALQFALISGAEVWVTSGSDSKISFAEGLGAKGGANYKSAAWAKDLKEKAGMFDVIIDGAGGPGFSELLDLAAPGGRIAIYGGTAGSIDALSPQKIFWKQLSILGTTMGSPSDFHNMLRLVNDHEIVPIIDEVFAFGEFGQAFSKMEGGKQVGKLVIEIS
jgi:zinc-binding alcohol dehydrogenase/oxidoreductase